MVNPPNSLTGIYSVNSQMQQKNQYQQFQQSQAHPQFNMNPVQSNSNSALFNGVQTNNPELQQ